MTLPLIAAAARLWRALLSSSAALGIALLCGNAAQAACLDLPQPGMRALQDLAMSHPKQAIETAKRELEIAGRTAALNEARVAALYAIEAQSYSLLELDADARAAALKGLELAPVVNDSTHLTLQMAYAENVYDARGIEAAMSALEKTRALQLPGTRADLCLQISIGRVQNRGGHADLALLTLTQAYRASQALGPGEPRVSAAAALSPVMRAVGDFKQALALNGEAIDWATQRHATLTLSVLDYLQGQILSDMRDYPAAIEHIERARQLSAQLADTQGIGFADLATCQIRLELAQRGPARRDCEAALEVFTASQSIDVQKQTQVVLARIDLAEGHPDKALVRLNGALARDAEDMQPRQVPSVYQLRAQANAALRKYPEAFRDLNEFIKRYGASLDAERARQISALRARFETDREIERNRTLQRELAEAHERSNRQRTELRWVVGGTAASLLVIALLLYLLMMNLRYRRELVRLASEDSLTGLPNRGRIAALAIEALREANAARQPLCVALIDLDRFKTINDRFGHATGDRVLQAFAAMARGAIRAGDMIGRWGGEEFLLVLPHTTLDIAVELLDQLRLQSGLIPEAAGESDLRVSISAGLASKVGDDDSLDDIVARADLALYQAKDSGRDLVRYAQESYQTASTAVRRALRERTSHVG